MERFKPKKTLSHCYAQISRIWTNDLPFQFWDDALCLLRLQGHVKAPSCFKVKGLCDENEVTFLLPYEHFCTFLDPSLENIGTEDIDASWEPLFFKAAKRILSDIFNQWGIMFTSLDIEKTNEDGCNCIAFSITKEDKVFYSILFPETDGNLNFLQKIYQKAQFSPSKEDINLTFPFRIERGRSLLSLEEVQSLREDDIILLHDVDLFRFRWMHTYFIAETSNETFTVKTTIMEEKDDLPVGIIPDEVPDNGEDTNESVDAGKNDGMGLESADNKFDIDQLPVKITFDVGKKDFSLEQLKQLHEGYTFELDKKVEEEIQILANGQCIGQGEWVQIEDRLGVRITHLFLKKE